LVKGFENTGTFLSTGPKVAFKHCFQTTSDDVPFLLTIHIAMPDDLFSSFWAIKQNASQSFLATSSSHDRLQSAISQLAT